MPRNPFKSRRDTRFEHMFETRSEAWAAVGLQVEVNKRDVQRAQRRITLLIPLLIGLLIVKHLLDQHIGKLATEHAHNPHVGTFFVGTGPVRAVAVLCVLVFGWMISRDLSRIGPTLFRRMDPSTAGTVEFLIRFLAVAATVLGALATAGTSLQALAVGGAFTAIVLGLAAQQTLGNLFAGMVLLSARPFRLGERVRFQAGALGGQLEGIVSSLGLLYTTLARGDDRVMIPNNSVLAAVVVPVREPNAVDVLVHVGSDVRPSHVQAILDSNVTVETRSPPNVVLEEIVGNKLIVRVQATPERRSEGAKLADEIIAALASVTGEHELQDQDTPVTR